MKFINFSLLVIFIFPLVLVHLVFLILFSHFLCSGLPGFNFFRNTYRLYVVADSSNFHVDVLLQFRFNMYTIEIYSSFSFVISYFLEFFLLFPLNSLSISHCSRFFVHNNHFSFSYNTSSNALTVN